MVNWSSSPEIFANLIQTLTSEAESSIQKYAGSRGTVPVGDVGDEAPHQKETIIF